MFKGFGYIMCKKVFRYMKKEVEFVEVLGVWSGNL